MSQYTDMVQRVMSDCSNTQNNLPGHRRYRSRLTTTTVDGGYSPSPGFTHVGLWQSNCTDSSGPHRVADRPTASTAEQTTITFNANMAVASRHLMNGRGAREPLSRPGRFRADTAPETNAYVHGRGHHG